MHTCKERAIGIVNEEIFSVVQVNGGGTESCSNGIRCLFGRSRTNIIVLHLEQEYTT